LLAWGLLPEESRTRFDWTSWLVAAFPFGVLTSLGALAALFLVFRPDPASAPSRERLTMQLAVLGPPSRRELAVLCLLGLTVLGWLLASALGVHVGVVAVFGLFGAVMIGGFDQRSFREIDWDYLIYYGGALSIASLSASLGVSRTLADALGGQFNLHLGHLGATGVAPGSPLLFILGLAVISLLVRLVMEPTQAALLLSLAAIPLAPVVGVNPWIVVIIILSTNNAWFLRKQTPAYLVAYAATDGRLYSHDQARRMAVAYSAISLAALALSVPYWHWLGLV
jgi:di/tricarboxylate transporter